MGTYHKSSERNIEHGSQDYLVSKDDPSAHYRVYRNIEKEYSKSALEIPIDACDQFEKKNIVLYPNHLVANDYYYQIRKEFFITTLTEGQEKAVKKILTYKKIQEQNVKK